MNGYEISGTLGKCKMFARNFPGAKLEDYLLPIINHPDHIILHIGAKKQYKFPAISQNEHMV